jgi:hypothetical protein
MSGAIPLNPLNTFIVCQETAHAENAWFRTALSLACKNICEKLANPKITNFLFVQWMKQVNRFHRQGGNTHRI